MKSIIICQIFCVAILANAKPTENESDDIGDVMREVAKDVNTALASKSVLVGYDFTRILNRNKIADFNAKQGLSNKT